MAGGIYVNRPFHFNPKCVFFGLGMIIFYVLITPTINYLMLPIIFVISYVLMAHYDYMYNCDPKLYSGVNFGVNTFDSIFKPQYRENELIDNQEAQFRKNVYLFHIFAISPILIYVGYYGASSNPKVINALLVIGIYALIYHTFRFFNPR